MKKITIIMALLCGLITTSVYAQEGKVQRDPKEMAAKAAEKLDFSDAQKEQLAKLNEQYQGDDYDKRKYREAFRQIMTEEQRRKADAMREKKAAGAGKRK